MLLSPVFHGAAVGGSLVLALPTPITVLNQSSKIYGFGGKEENQNRNTKK